MVGSNGGLQNVVLYISEGLSGGAASAVSSDEPDLRSEGLHVYAARDGRGSRVRNSKSSPATRPPTTFIPCPHPATGNIGWNQSQPPGAPPIEKSWKAPEVAIPVSATSIPGCMAGIVVVKGPYAITDDNGNLHHQECSSGHLHGDCLAGGTTAPRRKSDGGRGRSRQRPILRSKRNNRALIGQQKAAGIAAA